MEIHKEGLTEQFIQDYEKFVELQQTATMRFSFFNKDLYPCLFDKTSNTEFDRHYVYHPAWAARILKELRPTKHIDISSTLHFCTMLSAFIPTDFYDYRPANLILSNLSALSADLLSLPFPSNSIETLSCMHTIEHIGLGRYGDALDYDGDIKAINELKRVVKSGGSLLIVVPIGAKSKLCFNAHRIYSKELLLSLFSNFTLSEWALIPEDERDGGLIINPEDDLLEKQIYACGCFWFKKPLENGIRPTNYTF